MDICKIRMERQSEVSTLDRMTKVEEENGLLLVEEKMLMLDEALLILQPMNMYIHPLCNNLYLCMYVCTYVIIFHTS
jgi:hypothetical protein